MRLDSRAAMACREILHKKYAPNRFPEPPPVAISAMAQALSNLGFAHEARAVEYILKNVPSAVVIEQDLPTDLREQRTFEALTNSNATLVVAPVFGPTTERLIADFQGTISIESPRNSRPDVLVRVTRDPAPLGTWAPVDIKSHTAFDAANKSNEVFQAAISTGLLPEGSSVQGRFRKDDAMQLAHYAAHLEALGLLNAATWAGIIGRNLENITWARLSQTTFGTGRNAPTALMEYADNFAEALRIAQLAAVRNTDVSIPPPAMPLYDLNVCPTCKYFGLCMPEMIDYRGTGNVTLLATVTPERAQNDLPAGISIGELAMTTESLSDFGLAAQQRARVYLDGKPQLKVGITELDLPTFDIEIDIDLENFNGAIQEFDPDASLGPDRLYLYGYITHDRTSHANWDASPRGSFEDYSGTREGEHSIYLSMWNYLHEQIAAAKAAGHSIGIFHYSQHEVTWWGKWPSNFQDLPGTPTLGEVQAFVSQYLVDMYPIAKRVVFPSSKKLPICDYSIKTLAPLADFEWSVQDAGGAMSLLKYEEATSSDLSKSTKAQGWLRDYNIDDVRATMAVRNWIRKLDL